MTEFVAPKITQFDDEINPFIAALVEAKVKRFIEVGSRYGGSLWRIATALPVGSRIVSVDSGMGMGGNKPGAQDSLKATIKQLQKMGYDAHLIVGDSHHVSTIQQAKALGPYEAAFIDGDHTLEGITLDWVHYGRHVKICGFHDIAWKEPSGYAGKLVDCKAFWEVIRRRYKSETYVHAGGNMGVGVIWR